MTRPKVEISNDGRITSEATLIYFLCGICIVTGVFMWNAQSLIFIPLGIIILLTAIKFYSRFKKVEFDGDFFYYFDNGSELRIPISSIRKISPAGWELPREGEVYNIFYITDNNQTKKVKLVVHERNKYIAEFLTQVRTKSPEAEISFGESTKELRRVVGW